MTRTGLSTQIAGFIRRRRTMRVLEGLAPHQRVDIGLPPFDASRYQPENVPPATRIWLQSLR